MSAKKTRPASSGGRLDRGGSKSRADSLQPKPRGLTIRFVNKGNMARAMGPLPQALIAAITTLGEEAAKAGVFVEMGGLMLSATEVLIRLSDGKPSITDGPFTEAKEVIGASPISPQRRMRSKP